MTSNALGRLRTLFEVQRVAAMAILAAWKKGERRRVKLAILAIQAAERKAKPPLSEHKKRG